MGNVRWLHVSDIHMNKRGVENDRMRQKLIEYLKSNKMKFDYIFFTGDMRYAPDGDFAENTVAYLKELCDITGVERKNLFIVPGNHDIDRENTVRSRAIHTLLGEEGNYDSKTGVIKDSILRDLKAGRDSFLEIIQEIYSDCPERISYYKSEKWLHFCIETNDFNLVHLDSTICYTRERQRDFILGTEQLLEVLKQLNPEKTTIILTHYSSDFLTRSEQKIMQHLLMDYHVQLWIAGHEHDDLFRKQRDYFYEFQCGNLIFENGDTKSCIAVGDYDTVRRIGSVQLHYWDSPKGWALSPFVSNQKDPTAYKFELTDHAAITKQIVSTVQSAEFRNNSERAGVFNVKEMSVEQIKLLEKNGVLEMKKELGTRLTGTESKEEILQMFLYEMKSSFHSGKRFECMPIFQNVIRDIFDCYIYLDREFAPFMKARVLQFYFDEFDKFVIYNETLHIEVLTYNKEIASISFSYNLSRFGRAEERLYHFEKIKRYIASNTIFIKMVNHEECNLSFQTALPTNRWKQTVEDTEFWMEQMRMIVKIEEFYGVQFNLPTKASEDDWLAISILNDSIAGKSVRLLPGVPMDNVRFRRRFYLEDDVYIDQGEYLPVLHLFGYAFASIAQYMIKGVYYWDRRKKSWVSKSEEKEGIPIRVEFRVIDIEETG